MATTLTNLPVTRWTISGFSGPQPLAGTEDRAREAYAAMCAAEWVRSIEGASIPAHHYDFASPQGGDAYRQTWGYDAVTRTERSACGAVCYSVKIPADALTGDSCSVASVAASIFGDRWLDGGAIVSAILSADATPPAFSDFLSASATTTAMLAPTPATKPAGADAKWRNARADGTATLALTVGSPATAWLHVCLRVANYLFVYGAWHDGGAMLNPDTLSVTFSRDVTPDASAGTPLDVGLLAQTSGSITAHEAITRLPLASVWINWTLLADPAAFSSLAASTDEAKVRNLLSYILNSPDLYDGRDSSVLSGSSARLSKQGVSTVMTTGAFGFCALVSHGLAAGRTYTGLTLANPINPTGSTPIPYRLLVYAVEPLLVFGSAPPAATPVPWWGDVISRGFREGRATSLKCLSDPAAAHGVAVTDGLQSSASCSSSAVTPLACLDVTGTLSEIPFSAPFKAGELATVLLALVPNAAPLLPSVVSDTVDVTVRRSTYGVIANSGAAAATSNGDYATTNDNITVSFKMCHAHHITDWSHLPGVTTKNGRYVWKSQKDVTWTDYQLFDINLLGDVTIESGDNAGTYRWFTTFNGKSGSVYYNDSPNSRRAISWTWTYLGNYQGYDLARLYGHITWLENIPIRLVKLDENYEQTDVVFDGTINLANLHLWVGGQFVDTSKFPSGHTVSATEFSYGPGVSVPLEAWADSVFPFQLKYPNGAATFSFANNTVNSAVSASVKVEGAVSFTKNGVAYSADLPERTEDVQFTITYKSAGAHSYDSTPDLSYALQGTYTLPQMVQSLLFAGDDGTVLPMIVTLPARTIPVHSRDLEVFRDPSAKEIYNGQMEPWNTWTDTVADGATQSGKGLSQSIDVGLVTLH